MRRHTYLVLIVGLVVAPFATLSLLGQQEHRGPAQPQPPGGLPGYTLRETPLRQPLMLLREGKTQEARQELLRLQQASPNDAEIWFQLGRSHLLDFYSMPDPNKRRIALGLAMEALGAAIAKDENHIPALRTKAILHARAELLFYDPNLAYKYASRVAKLEPHATEYLLTLTEWMSGEVRFSHDHGHSGGHGSGHGGGHGSGHGGGQGDGQGSGQGQRVPQDPLLGLDRSIEILDRLIDHVVPFSNEETAAYFQMGKTLSRRASFADAIRYFQQALTRTRVPAQRLEALRELGTSHYRMGDHEGAARHFYEAAQGSGDSIDQWLLKVALDQLKGEPPPLPAHVRFPRTKPAFDGAALDAFAFEDMAAELGVDRFDGNGTCSWADYDRDGDLDLFLAGAGTFMAVFRNDGKRFTEVTAEVGLAGVPSGYSLNLIDYDGDGQTDLYVTYNGWNGPMPNRLFRNQEGRFVDVSASSGLADEGDGFVSLWGDLDNDGWLDLVIANGVLKDGSIPQIYRNQGDGSFRNVTKAAGIDEPPHYGVIGIALGDYDKDGDLDLFINGLDNAPNRLYRNEGNWRFTEIARRAGVTQPPHNGFVTFFFDYNNDGWPDLLTTSLAPWEVVVEGLKDGYKPASAKEVHPDASRLFRNNGNGTFTDVTYQSGLYHPMGTMGAGVADLDNDGCIDIYFGTGDPQLTRLEPNRFFRNLCNGTFQDWSDAAAFARHGNKGHGVSFVDIDGDGDLDLYAQLGGHYPGDMARNAFYRNKRGNRNHWLRVKLQGKRGNRDGIGAQVTMTTGGRTYHQELKGSEGFGATNPMVLHFGMGKQQTAEQVVVRWPSGKTQVLRDVPTRQMLTLAEPE
jgi:tetratricopeptide (TPR) repeat protein